MDFSAANTSKCVSKESCGKKMPTINLNFGFGEIEILNCVFC